MIRVILFIIFLYISITAQVDRETRAVWLATNFRLDWPPPTYNQEEQKKELLKIFDNIERKNLNTIYFQVRFNATVLFESNYEPWSYYLTGEVGGEPEYDPLLIAVREAHNRGLEIHAWFNMMRCYGGSEENVFNYPRHLLSMHPNWIHKVIIDGNTSYWLDPGLPEVQNYLTNIVADAAVKYEFDGIHLDYLRYPSVEIDDSFTYEVYGNNSDKEQWRRDNITAIVRKINQKLYSIDADIKIGAAPIGVYINKKNANGLQAYKDVYQESRLWLKEELVDYLTPQLYWNFEDDPKFDLLVKDWVQESHNRNIVIGIASYKDDVKRQTKQMIDYTRSAGASGVSFFRYRFIENERYFESKALPALMNWKAPQPPVTPGNLSFIILDSDINKFSLKWALPELMLGWENVAYYAVYNLENLYDNFTSANLFKIIPSDKTSIRFSINNPGRVNYYYAVTSLDKYWNESQGSSNIVEVEIPVLKKTIESMGLDSKPVLINQNGIYYLIIRSNNNEMITVNGFIDGGVKKIEETTIKKGINILEIGTNIKGSSELMIEFKSSNKKEHLRF